MLSATSKFMVTNDCGIGLAVVLEDCELGSLRDLPYLLVPLTGVSNLTLFNFRLARLVIDSGGRILLSGIAILIGGTTAFDIPVTAVTGLATGACIVSVWT
jgi:hypothetical protein